MPPLLVPKPGALWPPPRTERSSPSVRATATAAATSRGPVQRTTAAGHLSIMAL
jgi:hypothetical protein